MANLPPASRRIVALALWAGALTLGVLSALLYTGVIPMAEDGRVTVAAVLGAVAVADLAMGFWFFRSSLSS